MGHRLNGPGGSWARTAKTYERPPSPQKQYGDALVREAEARRAGNDAEADAWGQSRRPHREGHPKEKHAYNGRDHQDPS